MQQKFKARENETKHKQVIYVIILIYWHTPVHG